MIIRFFVFLCITASCLFRPAVAQTQLPDSLSDQAVVSILTIAPAGEYFTLGGHVGLLVLDHEQNLELVVNYAVFDNIKPWFKTRFVFGQMLATVATTDINGYLFSAALGKRAVQEHVLNLSPELRDTLWNQLKDDLREENKEYVYDFYSYNCTTRVLDLLLETTSAALPDLPESYTYRTVVDEPLGNRHGVRLFKNWAYGSVTDRVLTSRQRGFMPMTLMTLLEGARLPDGAPLVASTSTVMDFPPHRDEKVFPVALGVVALITLLLGLWTLVDRKRGTRWLDHTLLVLLGIAGCVLIVFWFMTYHWLAQYNANLLWAWPSHLLVGLFAWNAPWLRTYLRVTAVGIVAVVAAQLLFLQPFPMPLLPLMLIIAVRFWLYGSRLPSRSARLG